MVALLFVFQALSVLYLNSKDVDSRPLIDQMNETGTIAVQEEIRPKLNTVESRLVKLEKGDVAQMTQRVDQHDDRLKNITARLRKVEDFVSAKCLGIDPVGMHWFEVDTAQSRVFSTDKGATEYTPDRR